MMLLDELRNAYGWLRRRLAGRADSEHEQILIRIVITFMMFVYIMSVPLGEDAARIIRDSAVIYTFAVVSSLALLAHLVARPAPSPVRRVCGIAVDAIGVNGAIYAGGEAAMFFFPFLLWSILGHGFRYGRVYLAISAISSAALFVVVVMTAPAWRGFAALDIGLVLSLVMLPAYFAVLLGKLEGAVTKAEEASRAKSRFLATMSHEFRTPLNAVIGMTDLLRTTELDAEQRDMTMTTNSAAHSLLALVNDVLDIAKIESGRFTIDAEPFDLFDQLASLRRMLHLEAQSRALYLRLRIDPRVPRRFVGGRGPLNQVLVNLAANAIKFTAQGGVLIDVRLVGDASDAVRLRFEVHDTGIGIAPDAQAHIFESFAQAEAETSRRFGGTGLGLAIARELTELLGGRIGVVSAVGQGSSFWVELPLERDVGPVPMAQRGWADAVVVVLGGREASEAAMARLERLGIAGLAVADATTAVDSAVSSGLASAIMVVASEPAIDIESLSEALDHRRPGEPIDIVTLLPERVQHLAWTLADLAAADDDMLLERVLHMALRAGESGRDAVRGELVARRPVEVLLVEDNRTNQHVIGKILEHAGHTVAIAESGETCLELLEAGHYDIVLLDLNMPGMSGFDTIKMMRFMLPLGELPPVVALTADATSETREAALSLGFSAYVTKPIDSVELLAKIDQLSRAAGPGRAGQRPKRGSIERSPRPSGDIAEARAGRPNAAVVPLREPAERAGFARAAGRSPVDRQPEAPRRPAGGEGTVLDERKIATLLQLDAGDGFFAQVVDDYLLDVAQLLKEMEQAGTDGDARGFRDAAHALKSSSAHIGAQGVFEACVGLRHLDDHALLLRLPVEIGRLRTEIERASQALQRQKAAAVEPPSRRREGS